MDLQPSRAGDLADFLERSRARGEAFCRQIVGDAHLAEDLYQDACVRLLKRGVRTADEGGSQAALLFTTLKNLCISYLRRPARKQLRLERVTSSPSAETSEELVDKRSRPPDEQIEADEAGALFRQAVEELDEKKRMVFLMKEVDQLSYREIAGKLGLTESEVGVLIFRAREHLRKKFRRHA